MDEKTTQELLSILKSTDSINDLEHYISKEHNFNSTSSFAEYFLSLPSVSSMKKSDIIRKSGIDRTYCYQIFNGTKAPGRDKIICLSIAASLTLQETQRALEIAGEAALYSRNRQDAIIIYAINHGLSIYDTEELLCYFDEKK